jgi:hypothetical protein
MPISEATIGYGARVYVETAESPDQSPPDYTELSEITNMSPPNFQADDVDVTHMQSPDRTREFTPGLIDPGEASFEMNWVQGSDTDIILLNLKRAATKVSWKFVWANGTYWEFLGYVKGYETSAAVEDKQSATCSIKVSGSETISYIAAA